LLEPGSTPPPGWYPDPLDRLSARWWDGWQWGDQSRPLPPSASQFLDALPGEQGPPQGRSGTQQGQPEAVGEATGSSAEQAPAFGPAVSLPQPEPSGVPPFGAQPAVPGVRQSHWIRRHRVLSASIGTAVVLLLALIGVVAAGSNGVPSVIHGTVTATMLNIGAPPGGVGNCILDLPSAGSQSTLKAGGVAVASATLGELHQDKNSLGEICSIGFTFRGVPSASSYSVSINANDSTAFSNFGCQGTVYYTPAQLRSGKPLGLSYGSS
jgi:hypothetical protein